MRDPNETALVEMLAEVYRLGAGAARYVDHSITAPEYWVSERIILDHILNRFAACSLSDEEYRLFTH